MAVPAKDSGPGLPGTVHLLPSLVVVAALVGTLSAHALCQPTADWLRGLEAGSAGQPANERVSFVAKCVFMPCPLQRASFVAPCYSPTACTPSFFLQKELGLKAPGEAAGSSQYPVLVQDPSPKQALG